MKNAGLEFEDIFIRVKSAIRLSAISVTINLVMVLVLRIFNLVPIPKQLTEIAMALAVWLVTIALLNFYIDRAKTASGIQNVYFLVMVENILLLDWIIYNAGGGEWLGAIFYLFPVVYGNIIFSQTKGFLISTITGINYALLLLLEYFKIIPFREFFNLGVDLHKDPKYVFVAISFMLSTFYLIGFTVNILTNLLRKRTTALGKIRSELEELKSVLEIKIIARTKELEDLTKGLDQKVKQRTQELEESKGILQNRVNELERLHNLTIGRELKMLGLKKEIQKLKNQLNKKG